MNGLRVASSMGTSQRFSPSRPNMPHDSASAACCLLSTCGEDVRHDLPLLGRLRQVGREAFCQVLQLGLRSTVESLPSC